MIAVGERMDGSTRTRVHDEAIGKTWQYLDTCPKCGARRIDPQLGLEKTPELYVSKMVEVFREVKRIMHPTATLWLNMGDSYASGGGEGKNRYFDGRKEEFGPGNRPKGSSKLMKNTGLKPKDLLEMPSRLVLALQADGWWLRCRIPWLKRNAMPESVQGSRWERHRIKVGASDRASNEFQQGAYKEHRQGAGVASRKQREAYFEQGIGRTEYQDCPGCPKCDPNDGLVLRMSAGRPTQAVEYVFLLTKSAECFYDGEAVRVANTPGTKARIESSPGTGSGMSIGTEGKRYARLKSCGTEASGRSRRNSDWFFESWQGLWTDENGDPLAFIINPKPYKKAHFATFPPGLVIPCLKAGTSERGACPECGSPWVRVVEKSGKTTGKSWHNHGDDKFSGQSQSPRLNDPNYTSKTLGWRSTCSCSKEPVPCLAFDPFMGVGTVAVVARKMGRNFCGFEINETYVKEFCGEQLQQQVLTLKH